MAKVLFFLAAVISLAVATPVKAQQRVALVVGNAAYIAANPLASPSRDAKVIGETLAALGFTLSGGGYHTNVGKQRLDQLVGRFGQDAKNAEVVVFYFSGHGAQIAGTNYLLPVDASVMSPADVPLQTLNAEFVLQQMDESKARLKILILDACRDNPFVQRQLKQTSHGLAQMRVPTGMEGTVIIFATQPDSVARDGGPNAYSIYTSNLIPAMRKPGLDLFTLFNQAALDTMDATGKEQQPWFSASPLRGLFYLNRPVVASTAPAAAAPSSAISDGSSINLIQAAYKQLDVQNYLGAQATLSAAIRQDPNQALPYSYRGYMWTMQGNDLAKEGERLPDGQKKREIVRQALAKYALAFEDLDEAIRLNPNYQPARRHRGETILAVYRARKSVGMPVNNILDNAVADLEIAFRLDSTSILAPNALGRAYLLKGRYRDAIETFNQAIVINPKYAAAYFGRCQAWAKLNEWARARADADAAAARDSDMAGRTCLQVIE